MWILKWHIEKRGSKMCNTYLFHRTYFTDVVFLCWYEPDPNILQLQVSIFEGWIMRPEVKFLYSLRGTRSSQSFILTTTKEKKPELTHPPVRWVIIRIPVFSINEGRVAFWYLCRHDMNQQSYGFGPKRMKKRTKQLLFCRLPSAWSKAAGNEVATKVPTPTRACLLFQLLPLPFW